MFFRVWLFASAKLRLFGFQFQGSFESGSVCLLKCRRWSDGETVALDLCCSPLPPVCGTLMAQSQYSTGLFTGKKLLFSHSDIDPTGQSPPGTSICVFICRLQDICRPVWLHRLINISITEFWCECGWQRSHPLSRFLVPPSSAQSGCDACVSVSEGCGVTNFEFFASGPANWEAGMAAGPLSAAWTPVFFVLRRLFFNKAKKMKQDEMHRFMREPAEIIYKAKF